MVLVTRLLTWMTAMLNKVVTALGTAPAGALMPTATLHLYSNVYTPNPLDTAAAYTECVFSGYAAVALTLSAPVLGPGNSVCSLANGLFTSTVASPFVPDTAVGYYVLSAGSLVAAEKFQTPVPFAAAGHFLDLTVLFPFLNFTVP
jgi:hypothetical protein